MKIYRIFVIGLCAVVLTGCGHNIYIINRKSGDTTKITIYTHGQASGDVKIALEGKTYTGRWVFMSNGGALGIGIGQAFAGATSAFGTSTMAMGSTQGNGTIIAHAEDGTVLRCVYNYSQWNNAGVGECKTSDGEYYDLQIN